MPVENFLIPYIAKEEKYNKGEVIIKEGTQGDWIYLILQGRVKIQKKVSKRTITITTLLEGDIFGEMILWQSGKVARSASVVADTHVEVGILDTKRLISEYDSISPRLKDVIDSLVKRLIDTTSKAARLAVEIEE